MGKLAVIKDNRIFVYDDRWITINADEEEGRKGQHVLIKENGNIVFGLGGKFKNLKDLGKKKGEKKESGFIVSEDELYEYLKTKDGAMYLTLAHDIGYNPVKRRETELTDSDIIKILGGLDKTKGSCVSVACAFTAQKDGIDILDFKGGDSQKFFSYNKNLRRVLQDGLVGQRRDTTARTVELLQIVRNGPMKKEYLLRAGQHMAVVRRNGTDIEYLELQGRNNGWKTLGNYLDKTGKDAMRNELTKRFKTKTASRGETCDLYDCDVLRKSKKFQVALGFINTNNDKQQKGAGGGRK